MCVWADCFTLWPLVILTHSSYLMEAVRVSWQIPEKYSAQGWFLRSAQKSLPSPSAVSIWC